MIRHQAIGQNAQARSRMGFSQYPFKRGVVVRVLEQRQATDPMVQHMIDQLTGSQTGTTRHGLFCLRERRLSINDSRPLFFEEDHAPELRLGGRYYVQSDAPRLRLSLCQPRRDQSPGGRVAAVPHLDDELLRGRGAEALTRYGPQEIFNTDQGCQCTSQEFTGLGHAHGIQISMDGTGRWRDYVFVERMWRNLKYEEVSLRVYKTFGALREGMARSMNFSNQLRPHHALDSRTPHSRVGSYCQTPLMR